MAKTIPDEKIIAALLTTGTIKEAAAAVELSERAIYDRMNTGDFKILYEAARADLLRAAVYELNQHISDAIRTISEIMQDKGTSASIRLQAAQTILNNAGKFSQRLQISESNIQITAQCNKYAAR